MTPPTAAILLSTNAFEEFYGDGLALTRRRYLDEYRNDWSWEYARALRLAGFGVVLYIASYGPTEHHQTQEGIDVRFIGLKGFDGPWRRAPVLRRTPIGRYVAQWVNAASLMPGLRRALTEDQVETLFVQEYWTARWDLLALRLEVPLIAVDQGIPVRREVKTLKRFTLPRARRVIVQTEGERDKVRRYGANAARIPNGVDTTYFRASGEHGERQKVVVIVARLLDVQKRISDLIKAVALLDRDWRLRILGSGPDEEMLRDLAASEGIADRCEFAGFVMDRDVTRVALQTCGVFALPSSYEGLPMALLEAMSCGAAVVASDIPAILGVVTSGRDGVLVPVGASDQLAQGIVEAYARRDELGGAARVTIERSYSQAAMGAQLAELVEAA